MGGAEGSEDVKEGSLSKGVVDRMLDEIGRRRTPDVPLATLGHKTLSMVQKYAHLAPGHSNELIESISRSQS